MCQYPLNVHLCTTLMSSHVRWREYTSALRLFNCMESDHGIEPNKHTYTVALKAAAAANSPEDHGADLEAGARAQRATG